MTHEFEIDNYVVILNFVVEIDILSHNDEVKCQNYE